MVLLSGKLASRKGSSAPQNLFSQGWPDYLVGKNNPSKQKQKQNEKKQNTPPEDGRGHLAQEELACSVT